MILLIGMLAAGCNLGSLGRQSSIEEKDEEPRRLTKAELAAELNDFADGFSDEVQDAVSRIIDSTEDRQIRRRAGSTECE